LGNRRRRDEIKNREIGCGLDSTDSRQDPFEVRFRVDITKFSGQLKKHRSRQNKCTVHSADPLMHMLKSPVQKKINSSRESNNETRLISIRTKPRSADRHTVLVMLQGA
jgi:hypothetical protein